jgi:hypothetical protein
MRLFCDPDSGVFTATITNNDFICPGSPRSINRVGNTVRLIPYRNNHRNFHNAISGKIRYYLL